MASRREAGRLAILKYVTHVAVSECTIVCATKFCLQQKQKVVTMMFIMPFRSSLPSAAAAARLLRSRIISSKRLFSSDKTTGAASPLVLWLESDHPQPDHSATAPPPRILMPKFDENQKMIVSSPNDVMHAVDEHYNLSSDSQQFVGGMGEQDLGVWFASSSLDPLNH